MDRNGNTKIYYNAQNKATRIITSKNSLSFSYDMNGNRFSKSQKFTNTYYIGKGYEYKEDGSQNITHKYLIYANGKVVAVHNEVTSRQDITLAKKGIHYTQYLHYDSLGSVDTITNQNGLVVERMAYKPFGEKLDVVKTQKSITNRGYTGHEHIEDTPFIHMNARLYDPTIGRFLSTDTIIQAPYDTQSYNRYSYVRNNPLKYTDPTGHSWLSKSWKKIKSHSRAIIGVVVGIAIAVYAPYLLATYGGATFGTVAVSGAVELTAVGAMSAGAIGGFAGGAIATGSLSGTIKGAVLGGLTAGFAKGIGDIGGYIGGNAGFATRVVLHGGLSSFMSKAQGGRWSSGFWSGAVGTSLAPFAKTGNYYGNVASNAIIGGTVSSVTGGKFANGAVVGAFRYMFNEDLHEKYKEKGYVTSKDGNYKTMSAISKEFDKVYAMNPKEFNEYISGGGIFDAPDDNIFSAAKANILAGLTSMLAQHTANTSANGVVMGWKKAIDLELQVIFNNDDSIYTINYNWANQVSSDASTYTPKLELTQWVLK